MVAHTAGGGGVASSNLVAPTHFIFFYLNVKFLKIKLIDMKSKINIQLFTIILFIIVGCMSRIIPHAPNFTPIGAICLFGASHFTKKTYAFLVPILIIFFSDLFINNVLYPNSSFIFFYNGFYWQYISYILIISMSVIFLKPKISIFSIGLNSVASSLIFFIISNFGVWIASGMYPLNFIGFISCYVNALPFYYNTLISFLLYSYLLIGAFYLIQRKYNSIKPMHLSYV